MRGVPLTEEIWPKNGPDHRRVGGSEVGMVEDIEEFGAELDFFGLQDAEVLAQAVMSAEIVPATLSVCSTRPIFTLAMRRLAPAPVWRKTPVRQTAADPSATARSTGHTLVNKLRLMPDPPEAGNRGAAITAELCNKVRRLNCSISHSPTVTLSHRPEALLAQRHCCNPIGFFDPPAGIAASGLGSGKANVI
jgi:hypothetical protein